MTVIATLLLESAGAAWLKVEQSAAGVRRKMMNRAADRALADPGRYLVATMPDAGAS